MKGQRRSKRIEDRRNVRELEASGRKAFTPNERAPQQGDATFVQATTHDQLRYVGDDYWRGRTMLGVLRSRKRRGTIAGGAQDARPLAAGGQ